MKEIDEMKRMISTLQSKVNEMSTEVIEWKKIIQEPHQQRRLQMKRIDKADEKKEIEILNAQHVKTIGSGVKGDANGQFRSPFGICYDAKNQHILVSDSDNHRIQIFNRNGDFMCTFGSKGKDNGQLDYPGQLSIQPSTNRIVVADERNNRIQVFEDDGSFVSVIGDYIIKNPNAVDCHPISEHIIGVDYFDVENKAEGKAHIFDPNTLQLIRLFGGSFQDVYGVKYHVPRKLIFIPSNKNILNIWSEDGCEEIRSIPIPDYILNSICIDPRNSNRVLIGTYQGVILVYDIRNDKQIQTIGSQGKGVGQFTSSIFGIEMLEDGLLIAGDHWVERVHIFQC